MKNNDELKKFIESNLKNNEANNTKNRLNDIEKSYGLINKDNESIIKPRQRSVNPEVQSDIIMPNHNFSEPHINNLEQEQLIPSSRNIESIDKQLIIPRKKPELKFIENSKKEISKTIEIMKTNLFEASKDGPKSERRYYKQQSKIWNRVEKAEIKLNHLVNINRSNSPEFEKTIELQNQYINKIRKINEKINSLYQDDMSNLSLLERKKAISSNSTLLSNKNIMYAKNLRANDSSGNSLKNDNSHYKQIESNLNHYISARNPFYERLQKINERGGITVEAEFEKKEDRIAEKWLERAYNMDSSGKIKPRVVDFEKDSEE